ncbi:uncharacterized protein LOC143301037 [Babylonia areolata]|uniref:uncharacterized protein LOC143301037 n=1 Tax=Babylonia areolata TaxID=304850 RepID=UPI003FD29408
MYETARFVADILSPLVRKTEHSIANSADLVKKLSKFVPQPDESLVSYDITALFTSVLAKDSIDIIRRRLQDDDSPQQCTILSVEHICDLLSCYLNTIYFTFEGQFINRPRVQPWGPSLRGESPGVVPHSSTILGPLHGRHHDRAQEISGREDFTTHLNKQHPAIKFTYEVEENGSIAMLDTRITRTETGLAFSVYRKPTHTDQYLQFNSHQPLEHKLGVIRTLTLRAKTICSTDTARGAAHQESAQCGGIPEVGLGHPGGQENHTPPLDSTPNPVERTASLRLSAGRSGSWESAFTPSPPTPSGAS